MNSNKFLNEKLIWGLFFISALFAVVSNLSGAGLGSTENGLILLFAFVLPFLAVYAHAFYALGGGRSLFFLILSASIGLIFEIVGVNFGTAFGNSYSYAMSGPDIAGVPLIIPLFWFVFIYTAYGSVNALIKIKGGGIPAAPMDKIKSLVFLVLSEAALVTIIDLIMDPVMVSRGEWTWGGGGPYFNIPTENFLGWFLISLLVTGIYRTFEYYYPGGGRKNEGSVIYIPLFGLTTIYISFILYAFMIPLWSLGLLSVFLYLPLVFFLLNAVGNAFKKAPVIIRNEQ